MKKLDNLRGGDFFDSHCTANTLMKTNMLPLSHATTDWWNCCVFV